MADYCPTSLYEKGQNDTLKQFQGILLDILTAIDGVCREHHLRYYLIAGTMLGAVRHKGFIPWDDDADIAMPRQDYETFLAHANEWLPKEYELVTYATDSNYPYLFARVQDIRTTYIMRRSFNHVGGVPVDVFPLDGMPDDAAIQHSHFKRYQRRRRRYYFSHVSPYKHGHGLRSLFVKLYQRCVDRQKLYDKAIAMQKTYDFETSPCTADHDNLPPYAVMAKDIYGTPTPYEFEGRTLMGVENADAYLRHCYGDYMVMPSHVPCANFKYLDLCHGYKDYKPETTKKKEHE